MREGALLSRRAAAALPLAALVGSAPATVAAPSLDFDMLAVGTRWQVACAKLHAHDLATAAMSSAEMDSEFEELGDRLYADEWPLFDTIMKMPCRSLSGLALKARLLARAFDVLSPSAEALEKAISDAGDFQEAAALAVALDILRLTGAVA